MEKWIETDLEKRLAYIKESAWQHAVEQMNIAETYLRKHPARMMRFILRWQHSMKSKQRWERSWISNLRMIAGRSI